MIFFYRENRKWISVTRANNKWQLVIRNECVEFHDKHQKMENQAALRLEILQCFH